MGGIVNALDWSKLCPRCDTRKSPKEFAMNKNAKDGRQAYCRECMKGMYKRPTTDEKGNPIDQMQRVTRLSGIQVQEIMNINVMRRQLNLPELTIKIRRCLRCRHLFETFAAYLCGCQKELSSYMSDRDIGMTIK